MMKSKLGSLLFATVLAGPGLVACGGDDDGGGSSDDGASTDDGSGGDGSDAGGTEPDAGGTTADGSTPTDAAPGACLSAPRQEPNEPWVHVPESAGIQYVNEPPASGTHYAVWATWDVVHGELARGYWVHNLEHGGIVLLHRPDAPDDVVQALTAAFEAIPVDEECGHRRAIVATDVQLTTPVAVIAADWVMDGNCIDQEAQDSILQFVTDHRGNGPEDLCDEGTIE